MKAMIFNYYLTTGMMDALRLILECDDIGPLVKVKLKGMSPHIRYYI